MSHRILNPYVLLIVSLLTFRLVVPTPLGPVPIVLVFAIIFLINAIHRDYFSINVSRFLLFTLFLVVVVLTNLLNAEAGRISINSGLLVLSIWLLSIFEIKAPFATYEKYVLTSSYYVKVLLFSSCFAILQGLFSLFLRIWIDPLSLIPKQFQIEGFNTTYAMGFRSNWNRANGGIFPEPSYYSLFAGFALVVLFSPKVYQRIRFPNYAVTIIAIGILFSGTISALLFFPLICVQIISQIIRKSGSREKYIFFPIVSILMLLIALPNIRNEFQSKLGLNLLSTTSDSTLAARITRPYSFWFDALSTSPLLGQGSGTAAEILNGYSNYLVNTVSLVKISLDYGLIGLSLFVLILFSLLRNSNQSKSIKLGILLIMIIPTDGMFLPALSYLFIVFCIISKAKDIGTNKSMSQQNLRS